LAYRSARIRIPGTPLSVPRLDAGPFVLRPFTLDDLDVVREASADPHIPLITTVPAVFTAELAGFRREGLLRGWEEIGGERRDLLVYGRLAGDPMIV
jgi:hypothetical protein